MSQDALDMLAARLRTLLAEQGLAALQIERQIFGATDQASAASMHPAPATGDVHVRENARVHGPVTGVNFGTIQAFFGAQPPTDGKALLDSYLEWLLAEYGRLRLGKLLGKAQSGREQEIMPALSLRAVYTSLATTAWIAGDTFALERDAILKAMDAGHPAQVLPDRVRVAALQPTEAHGRDRPDATWHPLAGGESLADRWQAARRAVADAPAQRPLHGQWYRPETPLTALHAHPHLVLLGNPGSGKSTVLRYLTIILAESLLAGTDAQRPRPIPLFCQLGRVAQAFGDDPAHDPAMLVDALLQPVFGPAGIRAELRGPILQAWRRGSALICLDGLDEVSGVAEATSAGQRSRRERMATALRQLARQLGRTRMVVTCRTRPYEQDAAWHLREDWTVRTLQPFAFGQVRHFVPAWYAQTCTTPQPTYTHADAQTRAERLVTALEQRAALQGLTTTPLLVTMLALLDYNHKELPDKRVDVYEELVTLRSR